MGELGLCEAPKLVDQINVSGRIAALLDQQLGRPDPKWISLLVNFGA